MDKTKKMEKIKNIPVRHKMTKIEKICEWAPMSGKSVFISFVFFSLSVCCLCLFILSSNKIDSIVYFAHNFFYSSMQFRSFLFHSVGMTLAKLN